MIWFFALPNLVLAIAGCIVAMRFRREWTATGIVIGFFVGRVLAVAPLMIWMANYEARTGFGAGNAGVLFCCTVPIVPLMAMTVLGSIGDALDERQAGGDHEDIHCPDCGYDLTGNESGVCLECGYEDDA